MIGRCEDLKRLRHRDVYDDPATPCVRTLDPRETGTTPASTGGHVASNAEDTIKIEPVRMWNLPKRVAARATVCQCPRRVTTLSPRPIGDRLDPWCNSSGNSHFGPNAPGQVVQLAAEQDEQVVERDEADEATR